MAQAVVYSKTGTKKDTPAKLSAKVFGVEPNNDLLGMAYRVYMANGREGSAKTLSRGMVRGGGRKPHKQKGTGRARAGSSRIGQWTGGGVIFGPTGEENFTKTLPTKVKRAAIRQALSLQAKDKKVIILESFNVDGKTKSAAALLQKLDLAGRVVMVVEDRTPDIDRSTRNLPALDVITSRYLNVALILNADWILMTAKAHDEVTAWLEASA